MFPSTSSVGSGLGGPGVGRPPAAPGAAAPMTEPRPDDLDDVVEADGRTGGKDRMKQSKFFVFTVNNYNFVEEFAWDDNIGTGVGGRRSFIYPSLFIRAAESFANGEFTYLIVQEEVAPTSGTPHLQGYIEFATKKRFGGVHDLFIFEGEQPWIRSARGSGHANKVYCTKVDDRPLRYKDNRRGVLELGRIRNFG